MIAENLIGFENIPQTIPHYCFESFTRHNKRDALAYKIDDAWNYINGNEDIAYDMAVQADGKILVAGVVVDSLQRYTPAIYRFTENGFLDMDFGTDGLAIVPVVESENEFSCIKVLTCRGRRSVGFSTPS